MSAGARMTNFAEAIARAQRHSPFLARLTERFPEITATLCEGRVDDALTMALASGETAQNVAQSLRWQRGGVALVTAIADLSGHWGLDQVTHALSDFADHAVETALRAAFAERFPDEEPRGLAVLGLGKHGSRELNYSSDIDPIILFDPETIPCKGKDEPVESAVRLTRRMTELLNHRDGDGYVFRVDLRLRPSPEATPVALPIQAAISYYESMALGWEQAAFIRARVAAGDKELGDYFLQAIRPFIWRRSLDFGAIDAILDVSRRIRDHYASGQAFGPGYDMKRGRGGIREVEFFVQVHQLIHGGRNPELRPGATRQALRALAAGGVIGEDIARNLDEAYVLFRTIEHRLQMVDDRQTHELPVSAEAMDNVARLHGLDDSAALLALLRPQVEWVGKNYDQLAPADRDDRLSNDEERLADQIAAAGFPDVKAALARIEHWRGGAVRALRSTSAREALEMLLPGLVKALAAAADPVTALNRLDDMIGRLPSAINFFKLLSARPALVALLTDILSHAPALAEALGRRAELIDGLIDATALDQLPGLAELEALLSWCEDGDDYQMLLDRVRQKVGDRRFALGVQVVCGGGDVLDIGAGYARLAEAALRVLTRATIAEFERTHGKVEGGELVIVALGRLGGGVLTYASDLDLIFLFTGSYDKESDGAKPLGATQYFNRLSQRVVNALTVATASGPLYEVDTRLRPFGAQGLIAASVESFERYQQQDAWTWEHLALTRARPVYGSDAGAAEVDRIISQTLHRERDIPRFRVEAIKMRGDIAANKVPAGPLDVKLVSGGLVDLEFVTHVTQFSTGKGFTPHLGQAIATLAREGALSSDLVEAHDLLTRYLIVSRLVSPASVEPPVPSHELVAERCGTDNWPDLLARLEQARQSISSAWADIARTS